MGPSESEQAPVVAIFSAAMGAGHDKVAAELARRMAERGWCARTVDIWAMLPLGIGRLIAGFYRAMIWHFPALYDSIYEIWFRPQAKGRKRASPLVRLARRRVSAWMSHNRPLAVVSTFHLSSQILGEMRRTGALAVPVASMLVDFDVHDLWLHPDVDMHLCLHPLQAERAMAAAAPGVRVCGPVVRRDFAEPKWSRAAARGSLGLLAPERAVLIVAGAWGAGRVASTVAAVTRVGAYRPVVVAGMNRSLERRLDGYANAIVFGWVEDMARLVVAADVVVENAGGLTAIEAMAAGIPVISFQPIPGHGRANVLKMQQAGISAYAKDVKELVDLLGELTSPDSDRRRRIVANASAMWRSDAADYVAGLAPSTARGAGMSQAAKAW